MSESVRPLGLGRLSWGFVRDSLDRQASAAFAIMSPIWLTLADTDDAARATSETHPNLEAR